MFLYLFLTWLKERLRKIVLFGKSGGSLVMERFEQTTATFVRNLRKMQQGKNAPDICVDQHIFFSYDAPVNFSAWRHGAPVHIELSPWQLGRYTRAGKSQAFFV